MGRAFSFRECTVLFTLFMYSPKCGCDVYGKYRKIYQSHSSLWDENHLACNYIQHDHPTRFFCVEQLFFFLFFLAPRPSNKRRSDASADSLLGGWDHPRYRKWLVSNPPFISHKTAVWKGSHNPTYGTYDHHGY